MNAGTDAKAIEIEKLCVRYGRTVALEDVSLTVSSSSVYALLGRNGAGKSSLIRCLLGHQKPTRGALELFGRSPWKQRRRLMADIGTVAESPDVPPGLDGSELGRLCAGLSPGWSRQQFRVGLTRYEIDDRTPFKLLSRGQQALVAFNIALAGRPRALVLDDPTLGLDPIARRSLFDELIADLADRATTVFLATHDLDGVERIADHVGILQRGRLLLDESLDDLKHRFRRIHLESGGDQLPFPLQSHTSSSLGSEVVIDDFEPDRSDLEGLAVSPMSLEEIFVAVAGAPGAEASTPSSKVDENGKHVAVRTQR